MRFQIICRMDQWIWSSLQAVRGAKGEFVALGPGMLTSSPFHGWVRLIWDCSLCCQRSCRAVLTQVSKTLHTPVAMTTAWEEPGRSYCSQGRICQSRKIAGEGRSKTKSAARLVCGRKIMAGGRAGIFGWWQSTKAQEKSTSMLHIPKWVYWAVLDHPLSCYAIFTWGSVCWGYKLLYECQSGARECVSQGQDMPSKLANLPGSGSLYKCQERLHLQPRWRYVSLVRYPKTCRKNLPWVCVQMLRSRFGVAYALRT